MMDNLSTQKSSEVVVALDIGTTKVCAIAGRKNKHGKLEILGVGKVDSVGVSRGVVSNIEKTVKAIRLAIEAAERSAKTKFKIVHVGIAGQHIRSLKHRGILTREDDMTEISKKDIERLINDMHKLVLPPGDKILHVIPQEYTVDNEQGITDPIGMSGVRLEANFHIITGQNTATNNIRRCVERCGLKIADISLEPIASAESVLSEEEKEAGIALVDIGGGTTDVIIYQDGIIRHTAVIPFGGNVITKDIKEGCTVMQMQAEKMKQKFGSSLAGEVFENRIITIPGLTGRDPKEISEKNLARIIQARVEEIFDYVVVEVRKSGFENKLVGGLVLTGGGALMKHIEKLAEFHTGMNTRIGVPIERLAHGYNEQICSPIYATAIGLLIRAVKNLEEGVITYDDLIEKPKVVPVAPILEKVTPGIEKEQEVLDEKDKRWYENIFKKTKEWFEAEPDQEF